MANVKFNKNVLSQNFLGARAEQFARDLPTTPENGRPSKQVASETRDILVAQGASDARLALFDAWVARAYPESIGGGSPGAKGLAFGDEGRAYKAGKTDNGKTAGVRVPVEHIGVDETGYAHVRALSREDAITMLNRMSDENVILVTKGEKPRA